MFGPSFEVMASIKKISTYYIKGACAAGKFFEITNNEMAQNVLSLAHIVIFLWIVNIAFQVAQWVA